jgi:hypothetical protein
MALQKFSEEIFNRSPERLVQPSLREEIIADLRGRHQRALSKAQTIKVATDAARMQGLKDYNTAVPLFEKTKALVIKGERNKNTNPQQSKADLLEAGKQSLQRNFVAQRGLAARVHFEKLRHEGASYLAEAKILDGVLKHVMDAHNRGATPNPEFALGQLSLVRELEDIRTQMVQATVPDVTPPSISPQRNQLIAETMQVEVRTAAVSRAVVPKAINRPAAGLAPLSPSFSSSPLDALSASLGIPGFSSGRYGPGVPGPVGFEAVSQQPVEEVAHDGQVPRAVAALSGLGSLGALRSIQGLAGGTPVAPTNFLMSQSRLPVGTALSGVRGLGGLGSLGEVLNCDLGMCGLSDSGNRINTTSVASSQAATSTPAPGVTTSGDCDWLCQLKNAFGAVAPVVGGSLVAAGGASAASGNTGGGAAMGLLGSAIGFFGSFFGGAPAAGSAPPPPPKDEIMGVPTPLFLIGAVVAAGGLYIGFRK